MYAGLENASGDYVVIMDADLQHPPYLLESMYQALKYEDYDCCAGKRIDRIGENKLRNFLTARCRRPLILPSTVWIQIQIKNRKKNLIISFSCLKPMK